MIFPIYRWENKLLNNSPISKSGMQSQTSLVVKPVDFPLYLPLCLIWSASWRRGWSWAKLHDYSAPYKLSGSVIEPWAVCCAIGLFSGNGNTLTSVHPHSPMVLFALSEILGGLGSVYCYMRIRQITGCCKMTIVFSPYSVCLVSQWVWRLLKRSV